MLNQIERIIVLAAASVVSMGVTGTVCWAAIQTMAGAADAGLQNLLFGGLIGTGAFGAGALIALLGMAQQTRAGTGSGGPTLNVETASADIRASSEA